MADKTTGKLKLWIVKITDKISDTINTYLPENFTKIDTEFSSLKDDVESHLTENASTSQKGHVQLSTSTSSTSTSLAATASAVKTVNDDLTSHKDAAAPHSGHETPAGAQAKADVAETNAKNHANGLVGSLSSLLTTAKTNIVAAINEVFNKAEDVEDRIEAIEDDISSNYYNKTEIDSMIGDIETLLEGI